MAFRASALSHPRWSSATAPRIKQDAAVLALADAPEKTLQFIKTFAGLS
jgi:hypothetical protein